MGFYEFDKELYTSEFLNYDVTNRAEIAGQLILFTFDLILFFWIFENFRNIFKHYFRGTVETPWKMFCINFNLLLSVELRLFDSLYLIIGAIQSGFVNGQLRSEIYFNVFIHNFTQLLYLQLTNISTLIGAKMWIRIFATKYEDDEWPLRLRVYWKVINFGYTIVLITTFSMAIVNIIDVRGLRILMNSCVNLGTLISSVVFCIAVWALCQNFEGLLILRLHRHAKKAKKFGISIGFIQTLRFIFNLWLSIDPSQFSLLKSCLYDYKNPPLPDSCSNWAFWMTSYLWLCDFFPTLFMILLFSPGRTKRMEEFLESDRMASTDQFLLNGGGARNFYVTDDRK